MVVSCGCGTERWEIRGGILYCRALPPRPDSIPTADDASPMRAAAALPFIGITRPASPLTLNYASLVDLVHSLKEAYLLGDSVAWVMTRTSLAVVE